MNATDLEVLKVTTGLLALWVFVFYFWRDYRLDALRDDLFAIRDDLFVYAASGGVPFDHPAYKGMRERINTLLRYAHIFTMSRLLIAMATSPQRPAEMIEWEALVETVPSAEARERLKNAQLVVAATVFKHMVLRSLSLYLLLIPLRLAGKTVELKNRMMGSGPVIPAVERLEFEVLDSESNSRPRPRAAVVGA